MRGGVAGLQMSGEEKDQLNRSKKKPKLGGARREGQKGREGVSTDAPDDEGLRLEGGDAPKEIFETTIGM